VSAPHRLTDERLAWLAAKEYCERQASAHGPFFWVFVVLSAGRAAQTWRRGIKDKLMDYGVAVDDLARRLSPEERATLRAANQLPAWFFPAVEARFASIRRLHRDD
jgi:hypothetical protein